MPLDLPFEIALPDVEHEPQSAVHVRRIEAAGADLEMVEMTVWSRQDWRIGRTGKRRQIGKRVWLRFAQCIDDVHAIVRRAWSNAPGCTPYDHRFRLGERRDHRCLREKPKTHAKSFGGRPLSG